jgi:hypothetical protein
MPVMTDRQSVAANATVNNVIAGKLAEFLSEASRVALYAAASAVGLNYSLLIGGEAIVDDQEVSSANRFPVVPDDFVAEGGGLPGDRIIVRVRNTTGGAITAFTRIETNPVA